MRADAQGPPGRILPPTGTHAASLAPFGGRRSNSASDPPTALLPESLDFDQRAANQSAFLQAPPPAAPPALQRMQLLKGMEPEDLRDVEV